MNTLKSLIAGIGMLGLVSCEHMSDQEIGGRFLDTVIAIHPGKLNYQQQVAGHAFAQGVIADGQYGTAKDIQKEGRSVVIVEQSAANYQTPQVRENLMRVPEFRKISENEIESYIGQPGIVDIKWTTDNEDDNWGFNIMRSRDKDNGYSPINSKSILSNGRFGGKYNFVDENVKVGDEFYYYLEKVDIGGNREKFSAPFKRKIDRLKVKK